MNENFSPTSEVLLMLRDLAKVVKSFNDPEQKDERYDAIIKKVEDYEKEYEKKLDAKR